jgi:hypothetical protein
MCAAKSSPRPVALIAGAMLAGALLGSAPAQALTQAELEARVEVLSAQLEAMQAEIASLKAQSQLSSSIEETKAEAAAAVPGTQTVPPQAAAATAAHLGAAEDETGVSWFGYGELNYSRPSEDHSAAIADVGRFVIGAGYRFDDRTRFASELEVEHAISSAEDAGEVEVEQAYIEHEIGRSIYGRAGLMLIPSGLLNEYHEPTRYYGVFRNFVETAIIPTTWREGGLAFQGNTVGGLRWDAGITTGFDLSKWDPESEEGLEKPLGSIHQELSLAKASDLSTFVALNYTGVPGLKVGGSIFTGDASQDQQGFDDNRITLTEAHARYSPANWDSAALYAVGHIRNSAEANMTLFGPSVPGGGIPPGGFVIAADATPIPTDFFGWYQEGAYRGFQGPRYGITPFLRYERWNPASDYSSLDDLEIPAPDDLEAWTVGFNFTLAPGVVLKADYVNLPDSDFGDRTDLSVGYTF